MSPPAATADDLPGLVTSVRSGLDATTGHVDAIIAGVEAVVSALPAGAVTAVDADLAALRRTSADLVAEIGHALTHAGEPRELRAAGQVWTRDVGGVVSALAGTATLNTAEVDDHWRGPAADAYRNTLPAQAAAFTGIAGIGEAIDADLNELATAILVFWASIGAAITTLEVALLAAAAASSTLVGAPIGIAAAAGALATFAAAAVAAVVALNNIGSVSASRGADLQRRLDSDTAFPLGSWPRSTTPISTDAALADGDDTDWHLNR